MYFDILPTEIITHIFLSLPTVSSAIALSSTCHHFRHAYASSKRMLILTRAAESEFGPIDGIVQLLTHNASQPAHIHRSVPISDALLRQIVKTGRVAQYWESLYPFKKWKHDFAFRRMLTSEENRVFRRSLYRLWLFHRAFHTPSHIRYARCRPEVLHERAALLHNFSTAELAEMLDVHAIIRDVVASNVCPSNGRIRQKFQARHPDSSHHHQLLFNCHFPASPITSLVAENDAYYNSPLATSKHHARLTQSRFHEPGAEGWGDDIGHYYVVEDMMKLDPEQVLWLKENCPLKSQVEAYVAGLGEWFTNNGETFSETLGFVVGQRGGCLEELRSAVENGEVGVAVSDRL